MSEKKKKKEKWYSRYKPEPVTEDQKKRIKVLMAEELKRNRPFSHVKGPGIKAWKGFDVKTPFHELTKEQQKFLLEERKKHQDYVESMAYNRALKKVKREEASAEWEEWDRFRKKHLGGATEAQAKRRAKAAWKRKARSPE